MNTDIFQFAPFAMKRKKAQGLQIFKTGEQGTFINLNPITSGVNPNKTVGTSVSSITLTGAVTMPFVQATSSRMPTIALDAGKTGIYFDGTDDRLDLTDSNALSFFAGHYALGFVICTKWTSNRRFFNFNDPLQTGSSAFFSFEQSATQLFMRATPGNGTSYNAYYNYTADSNYHIYAGQANFQTGVMNLWKDGVKVFTSTTLPVGAISTTNIPNSGGLAVYGGSRCCFNLNALGFWRTPLSDARVVEIQDTIKTQMGL